eukprot:403330842
MKILVVSYNRSNLSYPPKQNGKPVKINDKNQVRSGYKADPKVSMIIKSSSSDILNTTEKERFNKLIKDCAMGLFKHFDRKTNKGLIKNTEEFILSMSKTLDGKTFTLFIKFLDELRKDVLDNKSHKLSPDSFLIFLDKIKSLTHSDTLNDLIIRKLSNIDINLVNTKDLLNVYQKNSIDFKFEENLRMDEIRQFANEVIPKPRFIFDRYQTSLTNPKGSDSEISVEESAKNNTNEEYFSFFSSHEKVILRPESNFKNLRQFMHFLPIDYYILLQKNFETESHFKETNYILFRNLPLLNKRKNPSGLNVVRPVLHLDIVNSTSKEEAGRILNDEMASEELLSHLEKRFGQIENFFFINYKPNMIIDTYNKTMFKVKVDEMQEFERNIQTKVDSRQGKKTSSEIVGTDSEINQENPLFDDLIQLASEEFMKAEEEDILEEQSKRNKKSTPKSKKRLNQEQEEQVIEQVKSKEKEMLGLNKQINRTGFIKFKTYEEKLRMMAHPLFLFGMKLYTQEQSIEFFDADFCNTITVQSPYFEDKTLGHCCKLINEFLIKSGNKQSQLVIGTLKGMKDEFDLNNIIVRDEFKISIRFNTFEDALDAMKSLTSISDKTRSIRFSVMFQNPQPNFYDGKLATQFESCIKDKFDGLNKINEVDASYVKKNMEKINAQKAEDEAYLNMMESRII